MDDNMNPTERLPNAIGRFQVVSALGFGAMGAVYKAFDPLIKRTLAIKTIRLDIPRASPQYRSFIERFHHEARISGTLSHPNIVTLFDIGEDGGLPYLAMEFIEGQTVSSLLEAGHKFKPERVIALASQVASALDYAHSRGVIHRDIKPSNMMIFGEDKLKVADFGIAKLADADMTQSGTLLGTPSYMSPEQAMGDKLDGRSDIFSLGVCCFEMLSGEQPFPGVNVTSILYKLVHVDPIEPANLEMSGLVPQKWQDVFGKVLAKKPEDRYQTATAFVQDLEFCLGSWFGGMGGTETLLGPSGVVDVRSPTPLTTEAMPRYVEAPPRPEVSSPAAEAEVGSDTVPPGRPSEGIPGAASMARAAEEPFREDGAQPILDREPPDETEGSATLAFRAEGAPGRPIDDGSDGEAGAVALTVPPMGLVPEVPSQSSESDEGTVVLSAPPVAPRAAAPPAVMDGDEGTVVLSVPPFVHSSAPQPPSSDEGTVVLATLQESDITGRPGSKRAPDRLAARGISSSEPTAVAPRPGSVGPAGRAPGRVPAQPGGKTLPVGAIIAGAAALLLLVLVVVGSIAYRKLATPVPEATPVAEGTPEPAEGVKVTPPPVILGLARVDSVPAGALVLVGDEERGKTPVEIEALSLGSHQIRVQLRGYEAISETVNITADAPVAELRFSLTRVQPTMGTVAVDSTPPGGQLKVDGRPSGATPRSGLRLRAGSHTLGVTLEGYEPWTESVEIKAGESVRVRAALRPLPRATPAPTPLPVETVDPNRVYENVSGQVDVIAKRMSGDFAEWPKSVSRLKSSQSASVTVAFEVTERGEVKDPKVTESSGLPQVDEAVLAAVRGFRFSPAQKKGVKVKVRTTFKQTYR